MRVGWWANGRVAHSGEVKRQQALFSKLQVIESSYLHEEIVGVLAIRDRFAKRSFSLLEKQRIPALRNGGRLETKHHACCESSGPEFVLRHAHEPIRGKKFVMSSYSSLLLVGDKDIGVKHEPPVPFHGHQHGYRSGIRLGAGTG